MTTRIETPRAQRLQSVIWIVAMLLLSVVVSGKTTQASRCPEKGMAQAPAVAKLVADRPDSVSLVTGLDLEVRIWNVRIGFPWLKSLPVTPGRRIVVSLWETNPDR